MTRYRIVSLIFPLLLPLSVATSQNLSKYDLSKYVIEHNKAFEAEAKKTYSFRISKSKRFWFKPVVKAVPAGKTFDRLLFLDHINYRPDWGLGNHSLDAANKTIQVTGNGSAYDYTISTMKPMENQLTVIREEVHNLDRTGCREETVIRERIKGVLTIVKDELKPAPAEICSH